MKKEIRNAMRIGFPFVVIMILVMTTALPVLADNKSKHVSGLRTVQGEVISVSSDNSTSTIVVRNIKQQQVAIKVDANTKYFMVPAGKDAAAADSGKGKFNIVEKTANGGRSQKLQIEEQLKAEVTAYCGNGSWKEAQLSDIQVGDRIIAWVKTAENLATQVLIIKPPVIQKVKGTITAISDNSTSITITPSSGNVVTLRWDTNTKFVLKGLISVETGQYAAAVYNRITMLLLTVNVQATAPASGKSAD